MHGTLQAPAPCFSPQIRIVIFLILMNSMAKIFDFQGWIIKIVATFMSTLDGISALRRSELLELKESWLSADFHGLQIFFGGKSRTSMVFCGTHGENLSNQFFFMRRQQDRTSMLWTMGILRKNQKIYGNRSRDGKIWEIYGTLVFSGTI